MRMRKKKHGDERILACAELLIEAPEMLKDDPKKPFADMKNTLILGVVVFLLLVAGLVSLLSGGFQITGHLDDDPFEIGEIGDVGDIPSLD